MRLFLMGAGGVAVAGIAWWLHRWHQRRDEYLPQNWTRRQAERAWKTQRTTKWN